MDIKEVARRGGKARAAKLTEEERKAISSKGGKAAKKARKERQRAKRELETRIAQHMEKTEK